MIFTRAVLFSSDSAGNNLIFIFIQCLFFFYTPAEPHNTIFFPASSRSHQRSLIEDELLRLNANVVKSLRAMFDDSRQNWNNGGSDNTTNETAGHDCGEYIRNAKGEEERRGRKATKKVNTKESWAFAFVDLAPSSPEFPLDMWRARTNLRE